MNIMGNAILVLMVVILGLHTQSWALARIKSADIFILCALNFTSSDIVVNGVLLPKWIA